MFLNESEAYRELAFPFDLMPPVAAIARPWFTGDADMPLPLIEKIDDEIERIAGEYHGSFEEHNQAGRIGGAKKDRVFRHLDAVGRHPEISLSGRP